MSLTKAIFPGSFDPIHKGHIDIIKRASKLFDVLYVVVSINIDKKQSNLEKRFLEVKAKIKSLKLKNVFVEKNNSLTVDFAKKYKCQYLVRSIRNELDMKYEIDLAQANYYLNNKLETIFFVSDPLLKKISSTGMKSISKTIKQLKK